MKKENLITMIATTGSCVVLTVILYTLFFPPWVEVKSYISKAEHGALKACGEFVSIYSSDVNAPAGYAEIKCPNGDDYIYVDSTGAVVSLEDYIHAMEQP